MCNKAKEHDLGETGRQTHLQAATQIKDNLYSKCSWGNYRDDSSHCICINEAVFELNEAFQGCGEMLKHLWAYWS